MNSKIIGALVISAALMTGFLSGCSRADSLAAASPLPAVTSEQPSPSLTPSPSQSPSPSPAATYTVKTDYSKLTPYEPIKEVYTRLSEGDMPELVPSGDYGFLMPYTGETMYIYDYPDSIASYQGLVTRDGKIVTDAVYSGIYYHSDSSDRLPVYILEKTTGKANDTDVIKKYAVCAADGCWISPFIYENILCCDKVMLLIHDRNTRDIDVMDYSGKILYNTTELDQYPLFLDSSKHHIPHSESYIAEYYIDYGEGYFIIHNGASSSFQENHDVDSCVFIDELSGNIKMEFSDADVFSEGLAAVEIDGLWGYINTNFSVVIAPEYIKACHFENGKAIVEYPSGEDGVIDINGNMLFKSTGEISYKYGFYFIKKDNEHPRSSLYDSQLNEISFNSIFVFFDTFIGENSTGYYYVIDNKTTVHYLNLIITLPCSADILWMNEDYIYYLNRTQHGYEIMTVKGMHVVESGTSYDLLSFPNKLDGRKHLIANNCIDESYVIYDNNGNEISTGAGAAYYDQVTGYLKIEADDYFAYMDTSGKYIFKISLQDSIPD